MRFARRTPVVTMVAGLAAAFLIGLLPSLWLVRQPSASVSMRDRATVAMVESHFSHAQFSGSAPPAKVIYAKDRAWLYVVVAAAHPYDLYAVDHGIARKIATVQPSGVTSEVFVEHPGQLDALQLRDGPATVATALVR